MNPNSILVAVLYLCRLIVDAQASFRHTLSDEVGSILKPLFPLHIQLRKSLDEQNGFSVLLGSRPTPNLDDICGGVVLFKLGFDKYPGGALV